MKKIIFNFILFLNFIPLYANNITVLSLKQCEDSALKKSPIIKALQYNVQSAQQNLKSKNQSLYPTLTLNAMGNYTAVLPYLSIMGFNETFGDYWGYSVGPTLDYILFDNRARNNSYKSIQNLCESKLQDLEYEKKNIIMSVRLQYFQIQAALEKIYILDKRLKLAQKQYKDISINYKSGAKSELDLIMANKQVLTAKNQIELARKNLSKYLRELFELTQDDFNVDPSYPIDYRLNEKQYTNNSSCILKIDDVNDSLNQFLVYEKYIFDESSPQLVSLEKIAQYYFNVSKSYKSQKYPFIKLQSGGYYQYPNGPVKEQILQGTANLLLSMPIFESSNKTALTKANQLTSKATEEQKKGLITTLKKDFYNAKDRLYIIDIQQNINTEIVEESQKISDLIYISYKLGQVTFLEVQTANLGLSQSRIELIDLKIEKLVNLAIIAGLGKE
ncbi:MAG: TolC family protein [Endomicrobium sp.]|jgi:outer membrane protein|uniref:TolC family protein n=1 Tax=Candidatus Endomicrobiellum cubanum TaxID=3242325 RepID=UPI00281D6E64|nr:TolC family protein [Endomicrobium sp.]